MKQSSELVNFGISPLVGSIRTDGERPLSWNPLWREHSTISEAGSLGDCQMLAPQQMPGHETTTDHLAFSSPVNVGLNVSDLCPGICCGVCTHRSSEPTDFRNRPMLMSQWMLTNQALTISLNPSN